MVEQEGYIVQYFLQDKHRKEIRENIIPNCKVRVEYVENGALIKKDIIPIQHCKKYINTGEELISIKDVVSAKIVEN